MVRTQPGFNTDQYIGRWYENFRDYSVPFERYDCATATYAKLADNYINVENIEYDIDGAKFG